MRQELAVATSSIHKEKHEREEPLLAREVGVGSEPFEHGGDHGPALSSRPRDYDPRDDRGYHAIISR